MQDGLKRVLDYSDYLATPDDGKRYEILRGRLLVTPALWGAPPDSRRG